MNGEIIANREIGMIGYKDHPIPLPSSKSIRSKKRHVDMLYGNEDNHFLYVVVVLLFFFGWGMGFDFRSAPHSIQNLSEGRFGWLHWSHFDFVVGAILDDMLI